MSNSHPSCVEQGPPRAMHSLAWLVATKFQNVSGVSRRPSSKNTKSTSCFVVNAGLVHILNAQKALSIHKPLPKLGVNQSLPGLYLPLCIIFKTMSRMPYVPCGNCSPFICITRQNVVTLPKRLCLVSCTVLVLRKFPYTGNRRRRLSFPELSPFTLFWWFWYSVSNRYIMF